jgi:hypothetical protein
MRRILLLGLYATAIHTLYSCRSKAATASENMGIMIDVPDSTYAFSLFLHDDYDPIRLTGIDFPVKDEFPYGDLSVTASSSNIQVVPQSNISISGTGSKRNLKIFPSAAGYCTITIHVNDGSDKRSYFVNYAFSREKTLKGKSWHTGIADASAAIVIDDDYMLVANDEKNLLYLYHRHHSGMPVQYYDFNQGNALQLTDSFAGKWKEVDVEAGVRSIKDPSILYWMGSMSNNGAFLDKPNRNRVFAIKVGDKTSPQRFKNAGHYSNLRQNLVNWGNKHGYDFTNSAAAGKNPKQPDGLNIEGMVFGPDKKTLYIGFRAPLVPTTARTKAIIAPIKNFENWFNQGSPSGDPEIAPPIELNLGGRGIRDIITTQDGNYVIIAGSCGADLNPAVYTWTGHAKDTAVVVNSFELTGLNIEGVVPMYERGQLSFTRLQMLTDNGNQVFYGDTVLAKNLPADNFKKFSSVITESRKENIPIPSIKQ